MPQAYVQINILVFSSDDAVYIFSDIIEANGKHL